MDTLHKVVETVLHEQKARLKPSTYDSRRRDLIHLSELGEQAGITEPCQELFDIFVSRATTPDVRSRLIRTVRIVDAQAGTKALTPEGLLYNEPQLPTEKETEAQFKNLTFPIHDGEIDMGLLIRRAGMEMDYLQLTASTNGQYLKAWRELYTELYLNGDTVFTRESINLFVDKSRDQLNAGTIYTWKWRIRRRACCVLLEVASTGGLIGKAADPTNPIAMMTVWKNSGVNI